MVKDVRNIYSLNPRIRERSIQDAETWGKWLPTLDWTYFINMNTRFEMSAQSVRRAMGRFFSRILSPKMFFWVADKNPGRNGYHAHGLLNTSHTVQEINEIWQITSGAKKQGDTAYLLAKKYDQGKGAAQYCASKLLYLYKDYDLF